MAANATEINETYLTNAANAIRTKKGTTGTIKAAEFPSQISSISTGSSASGTINITSNGTHDVSSYASANVNVPSGGESRLEWTINNSIPHTVCDIDFKDNPSMPMVSNENHLYNFRNALRLYLYPEWGYRFKESNEDYNIIVSETINNDVHNIGSYSSNRIKNNAITNNSYPGVAYRQYTDIGITNNLYTSPPTSGYSSTSSVSISGTAETEAIPTLTTFDTTGLTKQWTGTLTYSNGTLNTDNTFPYKDFRLTTKTCTLNLKINNIYYSDYNVNTYIEFNDTTLVNKSVSGQFLACSFYPSNPLYYTSNECYIQIGNIFINYIPSANVNAICYIPENCAMETLIEYLQANLVNEGDSIPIYKWVSGGGGN